MTVDEPRSHTEPDEDGQQEADRLHEVAISNQEQIHKDKSTHPGEGWTWYGNVARTKGDDPNDGGPLARAIKKTARATNVKFIEAAYDGEGNPVISSCSKCTTFYSVWVKR